MQYRFKNEMVYLEPKSDRYIMNIYESVWSIIFKNQYIALLVK